MQLFGYWRPRVRVPPLRPKRPFLTVFFYFVDVGEDENPPRALRFVRTVSVTDFLFALPWGANRVRILRAERVKLACKRQAREYSPSVKIPPYPRTKVLRRLASIVCYSAVRMRRMTQYTASGMRYGNYYALQLLFFSGASS